VILAQSEVWQELLGQCGRIDAWLSQKLTLVRIHELLRREGIAASYTTMRRFAEKALGWRRRERRCASMTHRWVRKCRSTSESSDGLSKKRGGGASSTCWW
jgi:hypothetical protein